MLVVVFSPLVGGAFIEVDEDVNCCGVLPDHFAVFIVVSAPASSLLFTVPVVAFERPIGTSMAAAAELLRRQRVPGPDFNMAC
jgi:hypothetical protein